MRKEMRSRQITEEKNIRMSERRQYGDQLVEKWGKVKNLGEGIISIYDKNPDKARGLCFILENQRKYLKSLTETQISNDFQTTPENVLRVVRLGYPNSVRNEIFHVWDMETARDVIYYLSPKYLSTSRGATAGNITHESVAHRYGSEIEEAAMTGLVNSSNKVYTGSDSDALANPPVRPYTVRILHNDIPVAVDDGNGNMIGTVLDTAQTNTINYTTGAITITYTTAPATGDTIVEYYNFDSEVAAQYTDVNEIVLSLQDYQFRCYPWPLGVSWSKMTELLLGTTLSIDAEEALIKGAGDELKKSLDFHALQLGYRYAKGNALTEFDADFASAGADSEIAHAQSFTRALDSAADVIFNALQRGGVTTMYGGPNAINYVKLHNRFKAEGVQPKIGAHKIGSLDGMGMYKVPSSIVPTDELVCVWKNENTPEDVSIAFGTLIPLYRSQTLEYKQGYKETGLFHFGDWKCLQSKYIVRVKLNNL